MLYYNQDKRTKLFKTRKDFIMEVYIVNENGNNVSCFKSFESAVNFITKASGFSCEDVTRDLLEIGAVADFWTVETMEVFD
jgi:hypothetical protein